jgi:hypothetical protein
VEAGIIDGEYQPQKYLRPRDGIEPPFRLHFNRETLMFRITGSTNYGELAEFSGVMPFPRIAPLSSSRFLQAGSAISSWFDADTDTNWLDTYAPITLYRVNYAKLAEFTAREWGIDYEFQKIPPKACQIGYKDGEIPVTVLHDVEEHRAQQALEVSGLVRAARMAIVNVQDATLSGYEKERLLEEGVVYVNSKEFLSEDGIPDWSILDPSRIMVGRVEFKHSSDYRSILWNGETYPLTPAQAAIVRILDDNRVNKTPDVGQDYLLEEAGVRSSRLEHLFKDSPLWRTLIVSGRSRGTFRLKIP